jgi:hypothetical protein
MTDFVQWLDTFVDEKGLDPDHIFEVEGPSGLNLIPLGNVLTAIKQAPESEQEGIRRKLIGLDFANAGVLGFFEHLAGALVI